jgi:hypothetical protein
MDGIISIFGILFPRKNVSGEATRPVLKKQEERALFAKAHKKTAPGCPKGGFCRKASGFTS